jgi:hypothetical protein
MQKEGHQMAHLLKKIILVLAVLAIPAGPVFARTDSAAKARAEAKKHFDRAMELNNDGQVAEAVIEFKRAYEIAPQHTVLYNLGQAYITLAKPVEAVAALQRYLDEGGKDIKPARRAEVEQEIARQTTRIATLEIRGLPDGAQVRVNGADVGKAPLGKWISVGIGDHVVSATAEGYDPAEVKVTVAGEDRKTVELTLNCAHGTHNDGRGTCIAAGCASGYHLAGAQCLPGSRSSGDKSSAPAAGHSATISAGRYHTCRLKKDGTIVCWGVNNHGQAAPPASSFARVSAGYWHTCGLRSDGTIACWGFNDDREAAPPAGTFAFVSAGHWHTCGVKSDGSIACWGYNKYGQATPPAGTFASVSAGADHTCGVKTDGTIACWGDKYDGRTTPPAGVFVSISAGGSHTCGVRGDGTIACWGDNAGGRATPPAGTFASVSAGRSHTCGIKTDGTVACWGDNTSGAATPPAGTFASVSAGVSFTCGVKTDGTVACWGDNEYGQCRPPAR